MSYIVNVTLLLAIGAIFYRLLLVKETFFRLNRYVLLACLALSFLLPLIRVPAELSLRKPDVEGYWWVGKPENGTDVSIGSAEIASKPSTPPKPAVTFGQVVQVAAWIYWAGVAAFGITFLVQLITLLYRSATRPFIQDGPYRIVEMSGDTAPCSFGNSIYINPEKYDWETYNQILLHEKIHIRDGHSYDLLISELVLVFHWFNPFAWLYRKELENNLEFLTDQQLLEQNEVDQESYQLSLLKVSAPHFPLNLTTNYNQSLLKKRFNMMNAKRSSMGTAWKYFFLLPLFAGSVFILNEPLASAGPLMSRPVSTDTEWIETEGPWTAELSGSDLVVIFKSRDDQGQNNSVFALSELKGFSEDKGSFSLVREAGTILFKGEFEAEQGSGNYFFTPDVNFAAFLKTEGVQEVSDLDMLAYFLSGVDRDLISMLKANGYTQRAKDQLIVLAALRVDSDYLSMLKENGFRNVPLNDLGIARSLGIDADYIRAMKAAGYTNLTLSQLINSKGKGIDPRSNEPVSSVRGAATLQQQGGAGDTIKPVSRPADTGNSGNKSYNDALTGITRNVGVILSKVEGDLDRVNKPDTKILTKEDYLTQLKDMGYAKPEDETITSLMVAGVTPGFIKSFYSIGFENQELRNFITLKKLRITPATVRDYRALGFPDVTLKEVIGATAAGATASYVKEMKAKGHNYPVLQKYISLKAEQR
ncbi:M56 family metallopeptidase [Daejeonella lutea]|uniref:Signal transducer regulating beta-lactamase production, contains metallopeptidase domain n=1 Tax=Daejeonella lutea TaxID=572036 RepID=A0A1T5CWX8_9SPHI|nr:M56 family metallopeptidase [Daejeonella lutea]SKB63710.1 Signal transducer regulating beta-lactamase production, contains metallopeptidase domain [Daejeonella lutea]